MNRLLAGVILVCFLGATTVGAETTDISRKDRIMGAIMGVLIGDALGVGSHWYYDLDNLKKDFGPWISDYSDPKLNGSGRFASVRWDCQESRPGSSTA